MIRLDYKYQYPPAPGDIDHPDSFGYDVMYLEVPGLTFEMCQSGRLNAEEKAHAWFVTPDAAHVCRYGSARAFGERRDARHLVCDPQLGWSRVS